MEAFALLLPWLVAVVMGAAIAARPEGVIPRRRRTVAIAFGIAIAGQIVAWMVAGTLHERTCATVLHALGLREGGGWLALHCLTLMLRSIGLVGALLCAGLAGAAWRLERSPTDATDP
jgi:hypothetical protein